jgi:hypothetical protein
MSHHHYEDVIDPKKGKTYAQSKDENKMGTPERIKPHADKYHDGAWRKYSYEELAQWVNLLTKRAGHRTQFEKSQKDLDDANNYLEMFKAKFAEEAMNVENSFRQEE